MRRLPLSLLGSLLAFLLAFSPLSLADIKVLGLFKGAALIEVDGQQKLVKVGQKWKGVAILEANSKQAVADVNGERMTLKVSSHIGSSYQKPANTTVRIPKNANRQYITNAQINGRGTQVLVDTGANIVALNSLTARALGIDFDDAPQSQVATASGIVPAYTVMLDKVDVGGITVRRVQASIVTGSFPETVLLGMSYLQHVKMTEQDGILLLTNKY
ncbi:MAG: retropepsin-like aspartic protease [Halieaceae bacterium]